MDLNLQNNAIFQIVGDASFRKFYRKKNKKKNTIVINAIKNKYKNLLIYCAINKFLLKKKILAPKLIKYNYKKGLIEIEDFGDSTLYKILLKNKNKFKIYKKSVDLLIKIQKIKPPKKLKTFLNTNYCLDKYSVKNLRKESDLFFDWYLPLIKNKKKAHKIKVKANIILNKLYRKINYKNKFLVHRDFHVSNLMMVKKRIGVIDTQDAIIGNPAYDIVSLVDDVRIKTTQKLKNQIFNYYLKKNKKNIKIHPKRFLEDFNILSVQRSLKIIGIFSRLFLRDKKDKYLKLIPYTWKILELRIKNKIFNDLDVILKKNVNFNVRKKVKF